jgi:hypothetical protein
MNEQGAKARELKEPGTKLVASLYQDSKANPGAFARFAKLVNEATTFGVDPSADRGAGRNKHLTLSKALRDKIAKGAKFDDLLHETPMAQWDAHANYDRLRAEYEAVTKLNPELKGRLQEVFDFFKESQTAMARGHITEALRAAGYGKDQAERATRADDILSRKNTDEFKEGLAKEFGEAVADHILNAKRLTGSEGPYAPLMRHGDIVVHGRYKVDEPTNAIHKPDDRTWEFKDRREALDFAQKSGLHYDVRTAHYEPGTNNRVAHDEVTPAGNPEKRYQVRLQRQHTEFRGSMREAQARVEELRKSGLLEKVFSPETRLETGAFQAPELTSAGTITLLGKLKKTDEYQRATPKQRHEMEQSIREAALSMQAGQRVQHKRMPRRNVKGESDDLLRTLDVYNNSQANYRAKQEFRPQVDEAVEAAHTYHKDQREKEVGSPGADEANTRRAEALAELKRRTSLDDPSERNDKWTEFTRRINTLTYINRMGRISHLILHQTHLPMITAPQMAGRHGGRTYAEVTTLWKQLSGFYAAGAKDFVGAIKNTLHEGTDYSASALKLFRRTMRPEEFARVKSMFEELQKIGLLHTESGLEIGKFLPHHAREGLPGLADKALMKFDTVFRQATNATEAINQIVGATAAYRLEFQRLTHEGKSETKAHDAAVEYARNILANAHGYFSTANQAPLFKNKYARPFLQFRQFPQMMYHLLIQNAGKAFKGDTKVERVEAAKSLAMVIGMHVLATGLLGGVPYELARLGSSIGKSLGLAPGDAADVENEWEKFTEKHLGKGAAHLLNHGAVGSLTGADVHHRLGLNSLWTFGVPDSNNTNTWKEFMFDQLLGAPEGQR